MMVAISGTLIAMMCYLQTLQTALQRESDHSASSLLAVCLHDGFPSRPF